MRYFNGHILFPILEKLAKRQIRPKLKELKHFENFSNAEQLHQQRGHLHSLLLYCQNKIPYYQELFKTASFNPAKVQQDIRYIQELPLLTKELVREHGQRLRSPHAIHPRKTGGSTGQSVMFFYDGHGLDWSAAINQFAYEKSGKKRHHLDCHFSSEIGLAPTLLKHKLTNSLKTMALNRKVLMVNSYSHQDINRMCSDLKRFRPFLVQGHPSTMYIMASSLHVPSSQRLCDIFEPSGEMITQKMVETIERNIGCKVVNRYGNAEFGVMAHGQMSDSFNRLKIYRRAFYIEESEATNIIVTGLTNYGMPLLRYDTGDVASVREEEDGAYIYDIQGRIHDTVLINDEAYPTHYIMDFLDHIVGNIKEFQVVVHPESRPCLAIIPEVPSDKDRIKQAILKKWPYGLDVKFIGFEDLHKTGWRQKFRHVVHLESQL